MSLHDERTPLPMLQHFEHAPHHFQRDAWVDPVRQRDRAMEDLAEEIAAIEDELQHKRAEYTRLEQWQPEPERERVFDARGLKSVGTDDAEAWR